MIPVRESQEEQCTGRAAHEGPQEALAEASAVERAGGGFQDVYCCPWCWWWHSRPSTRAAELAAGKERQLEDDRDRELRHRRLDERKRLLRARARNNPKRHRPPRPR